MRTAALPEAPVPLFERLLRSPMAALCLHPAADRLALRAIAGWYLPLCKALAVAEMAEGAVDPFIARFPGVSANRLLARRLAAVESRRRTAAMAAAAWEYGFFAPEPPPAARLADLQSERVAAANRLAACRRWFLPLRRQVPPVSWQIAAAGSADRRHAPRLAAPEKAFAPDLDPARLRQSHPLPTATGEASWLRFPSGDGEAWARVLAPRAARPPTVVYAHPFASEFDLGAPAWDPLDRLVPLGVRVVRAEGPWHGRRRMPGCFSGEPVLARTPLGLADYLETHVKELALLIAWAHRTGGRVALAGASLGALTGQMLAASATGWPAESRPDALLLISPSASLLAVLHGSLTGALGLPKALARQGWRDDDLSQWTALLQPGSRSAVPPERTLFLLGEADDVTPFASGQALAEAWGVPAANVVCRRQGHFLLLLSLFADDAPLRRLAALVAQPPVKPSRLRSAAR